MACLGRVVGVGVCTVCGQLEAGRGGFDFAADDAVHAVGAGDEVTGYLRAVGCGDEGVRVEVLDGGNAFAGVDLRFVLDVLV